MQFPYSREEAYQNYRRDPAGFFDEVIHAQADGESALIHPDWPKFWTKYHYKPG